MARNQRRVSQNVNRVCTIPGLGREYKNKRKRDRGLREELAWVCVATAPSFRGGVLPGTLLWLSLALKPELGASLEAAVPSPVHCLHLQLSDLKQTPRPVCSLSLRRKGDCGHHAWECSLRRCFHFPLEINSERSKAKRAPLGLTPGKSRANQQSPGGRIRTTGCWRLSKGLGSSAGRGLKE